MIGARSGEWATHGPNGDNGSVVGGSVVVVMFVVVDVLVYEGVLEATELVGC